MARLEHAEVGFVGVQDLEGQEAGRGRQGPAVLAVLFQNLAHRRHVEGDVGHQVRHLLRIIVLLSERLAV